MTPEAAIFPEWAVSISLADAVAAIEERADDGSSHALHGTIPDRGLKDALICELHRRNEPILLLVELGVGITVAAVMATIFFQFAGRGRSDV